ncbi:MAG TPA: ATP-dependent helicase, partial [Deltaproteobacteria bacterium]|nr:ATP-dependent helicase [Deltaproteobacteria bacterium]
ESKVFNLPTLPGDHEFYKYARVFGDDLDGFIQWCRLKRDHEGIGGEKVRVLTAHAVKGMEFRCVFMVGLEKGLFPLASEPLREEENLFYVAMTRAIDRLYLVYSHEPSCFIDRIPEDLKAFRSMGGGKKAPRQMVLFD